MIEIGNAIPFAINAAQIFLTFSMITSLLKIKVFWWVTLICSFIIAPLSSENQWVMLGVFVVSAFAFYFVTSKMQWKVTVLAIVLHLFSSQFVASVIQFFTLILISSFDASLIWIRIFSVFVYIALLGFIRYKKISLINLVHNKMMLTLSILMVLVNFAIYTYTPLASEDILNISNLFNSLWRAVIQFVIAYMALTLNKLSTEIEKHEFHNLYTDTLQKSLDNLSMFKHDSHNMINTLFGYCRLGRLDKIESYLKELTIDIKHDIRVGEINDFLKDNMPYLYGIVLAKSFQAATTGIHFDIRITADKFKLFTVSEVQLSRMVGNLLNNAFDAAKLCECKAVYLNISNVDDYRIKIEIINSTDAPVDTAKILNKGYSTKEGHSGLGLYQIQSIVERQRKEGFNVKFEFSNSPGNTFTAMIII